MIGQQIQHRIGGDQQPGQNSCRQYKQKIPVYMLPQGIDLTGEEQAYCSCIDCPDRENEFVINSGDNSYGAAGYSRNRICHTHGNALEKE